MIVEFPDGTELSLPDSLTDAQVQSIVDAITRSTHAAQNAMTEAAQAHEKIALLAKVQQPQGPQPSNDVVAELRAMREEMAQGFARLFAATMADTVIVEDPLRDEPVRSRKVL